MPLEDIDDIKKLLEKYVKIHPSEAAKAMIDELEKRIIELIKDQIL